MGDHRNSGKGSPPGKGPGGDPPQDENQIIAERRAKLAELRKRGTAFPNDFRREHLAADLHSAWDGKSNEKLDPHQLAVEAAGRMMLRRGFLVRFSVPRTVQV